MLSKPADTEVELTPVLADRWSPRAFDAAATLDDDGLLRLLEAARWQASANNAQPWRYLVARRGELAFEVIHANLLGFNQAWAHRASALVVAMHETVDVNGKPRATAAYDLGLSVANLVTQATVDGLHCHQMAGVDRDGLRTAFDLDPALHVQVVIAVGKQSEPELLEDELRNRELATRTRLPLSDLVLRGLPG